MWEETWERERLSADQYMNNPILYNENFASIEIFDTYT